MPLGVLDIVKIRGRTMQACQPGERIDTSGLQLTVQSAVVATQRRFVAALSPVVGFFRYIVTLFDTNFKPTSISRIIPTGVSIGINR